MYFDSDSADRASTDYVLFVLGFLAFMTAAGGIVFGSPGFAAFGAVILVLVVWMFGRRQTDAG
jgi:hypothetical protein